MKKLLSKLAVPLIQAPMAYAQGTALPAAVCRAGALGSLPAAMYTTEDLDRALAELNRQTGGAPCNVNFFAHRQPETTVAQREAWHHVLVPYLAEFGLGIEDIPEGGGRRPFAAEDLAVLQRHRPAVVSFHFGLPDDRLLSEVKRTGALIVGNATTVEEAQWLEQHGVDAVIAQGVEAGGHRGLFLERDLRNQSGLFALLPNIRRAVSLPVIAAGGVSDAAAVRAAVALGADAVQCGTAFLLADEAEISLMHRAALQSPQAAHTVLTNLFSGGFARGIRNRFIDSAGPICPDALPFPLAGAATGVLRRAAEHAGSNEFSSFWAGQNALSACSGSAAEIVAGLAQGFAVSYSEPTRKDTRQ